MWVMTESDWPVPIDLSRTAHIGYQQIAKFDSRTRVTASSWEQEYVLADCADGDQAKSAIGLISRALASGEIVLDLRGIDLAQLAENAEAGPR